MDEDKVFHSKIDRGSKSVQNNLFELISFTPVTPKIHIVQNCSDSDDSCHFTPKSGKLYAPKTSSIKLKKVKTVRDVRMEYEKDVYEYLPTEMEKKESYLLKKIRNGIGQNEQTNKAAANFLKYRQPVSHSIWQMLMNINPQRHAHPKQFVLWNGNILQVNGSKGGDRKYLLRFDIGKNKNSVKSGSNVLKKKKFTLLKNSLNVKFKPGPLIMKKELDNSFQRYILGEIRAVTLPEIVLDIEPSRGVPLEPTISNIIHSLEDSKGKMTERWASYAASALETSNKNVHKDDKISFRMNYKNNQHKILMRSHVTSNKAPIIHPELSLKNEADINKTVHLIIEDMLKTVDISLTHDSTFIKEDEPRPFVIEDCENQLLICNSFKDKGKRKFSELQKLDVTVIRLSEDPTPVTSCTNEFCKLGCICPSLSYKYGLKTHCGRLECMFQCKCDVSMYGFMNSDIGECPEWMPGLINLDNQINSNLAKEEKDFHQTVVFTNDKSIVIKSHRRNLKAPKRYETHCNESKPLLKIKPLTISLQKLDLTNVEPWCMVHSLYQCFCNCKFTDGLENLKLNELERQTVPENQVLVESDDPSSEGNCELKASKSVILNNCKDDHYTQSSNDICSRTTAFEKRRFEDSHYRMINLRIAEMEKDDATLQTRLYQVLNKSTSKLHTEENSNEIISDKDIEILSVSESVTNISAGSAVKFGGRKKLVAWLEANYKIYKERIESGKPIPLEAPKLGKMALYPWEVILDRYKSKKNYFLVTKTEPYRVFIAVNRKNPFFSNCVGIDELSFEEVQRYPITVRNLLSDADDIKYNFYILCGLSTCWELIGSVTKLKDKNMQHNTTTSNRIVDISDEDSLTADSESVVNPLTHSKWLYILVESDFSEIQFLSKGFFVKFDNIIKATNLSITTGKTVRLSSQSNSKDMNTPHFGIYAIPDPNVCSVFVGPYDLNENLDIETIMIPNVQSKESKGIWVYVDRKENANVIENILQYVPIIDNISTKQIPLKLIAIAPLDTADEIISSSPCHSSEDESEPPKKKIMTAKKVVPVAIQQKLNKEIKMDRSKPSLTLKPQMVKHISCSDGADNIFSSYNRKHLMTSPESTSSLITPIIKETFSLSKTSSEKVKPMKPVAEIAPQIKCISKTNESRPNSKVGMLVLKPEEINKRMTGHLINDGLDASDVNSIDDENDGQMTMDIENFLATSIVCTSPVILPVMSDDATSDKNEKRQGPAWRDVWIECNNIKKLGWIKGRRKYADQSISFEFPGFKYTEFYNEKEAFQKINQVLSRKVFIPKNIKPTWHVVECHEKLVNKAQINSSHFGAQYVLTTLGLRHKKNLFFNKTTGQ